MRMTDDQILELWKSRLSVLSSRKLEWIETTFFLPLILMILPLSSTGFQKQVVLGCYIEASILLVYSIILYLLLRSIKKHRFRGKYAYPKTILLYSLYDIFMVAFIGMIFWISGVLTIGSGKMILAIFISLLLVFIFACFSPQWIINSKIHLSDRPTQFNKYLPIALAISSTLPGLGLLAASILTHSPYNSSSDLVIQIGGIGLGSLLMYLSTTVLCEIIIIGLRKWPQIKRTNSHYSVDWQSD
jgi:hypothetical protein